MKVWLNKVQGPLLTILKIVIAGLLIWWLVSDDKLDFADLNRLWQNPSILVATLAFWGIGAVILCALRWRALVLGMNFSLSVVQSIRLNLIGLFFNTIMPGVVGGDLIKAIYVCKGQAKITKVPVLLTILLDRVMGLVALFALSMAAIILNWNVVMANAMLKPFVMLIFGIMAGLCLFAVFVALPTEFKEKVPPISWIYRLIMKVIFVKNIYLALRSYKDKPGYILQALGFAFLHQLIYMLLFILVTNSFTANPIQIGLLATVLPLAIVTTALPLAPGGLGVGHVAFEKLYAMIGLSDGANVFNIIFFSVVFLNLLGSIPYLFMRSELPPLLETAGSENGA
ncbi:MAG: flippase-like domain-containing protein [Oligoflexales bacterium]|nr:flippase-like domain-containing protein [Oligoflexales bacterium]